MVLTTKNSVSLFYSDSVLTNFPIYSNVFVTPKSILCFGGHLWTWQRSKKNGLKPVLHIYIPLHIHEFVYIKEVYTYVYIKDVYVYTSV